MINTPGSVQSGWSAGSGSILEHIEAGAGDLARLDRRREIVEPGRQAATDIDEEGGLLHLLKPRPVHEPFGLRSVRHRQDHEIRQRQQGVKLVGAMQFGDPGRHVAAALVDADDAHAESGSKPRHLAADAADADDQRHCLGQMDDPVSRGNFFHSRFICCGM